MIRKKKFMNEYFQGNCNNMLNWNHIRHLVINNWKTIIFSIERLTKFVDFITEMKNNVYTTHNSMKIYVLILKKFEIKITEIYVGININPHNDEFDVEYFSSILKNVKNAYNTILEEIKLKENIKKQKEQEEFEKLERIRKQKEYEELEEAKRIHRINKLVKKFEEEETIIIKNENLEIQKLLGKIKDDKYKKTIDDLNKKIEHLNMLYTKFNS